MFNYILASLFSLYFLGISSSTTPSESVSTFEVSSPPVETQVQANANLDEFASCLKDKGVTFYGAFWCPHCQAQKALFGKSLENLSYVECSTPDGNGQLDICKEAEIQGYPTWRFADGSEASGEQSLAQLSQKTGCELPIEE